MKENAWCANVVPTSANNCTGLPNTVASHRAMLPHRKQNGDLDDKFCVQCASVVRQARPSNILYAHLLPLFAKVTVVLLLSAQEAASMRMFMVLWWPVSACLNPRLLLIAAMRLDQLSVLKPTSESSRRSVHKVRTWEGQASYQNQAVLEGDLTGGDIIQAFLHRLDFDFENQLASSPMQCRTNRHHLTSGRWTVADKDMICWCEKPYDFPFSGLHATTQLLGLYLAAPERVTRCPV